jgi:hypothetical protein
LTAKNYCARSEGQLLATPAHVVPQKLGVEPGEIPERLAKLGKPSLGTILHKRLLRG